MLGSNSAVPTTVVGPLAKKDHWKLQGIFFATFLLVKNTGKLFLQYQIWIINGYKTIEKCSHQNCIMWHWDTIWFFSAWVCCLLHVYVPGLPLKEETGDTRFANGIRCVRHHRLLTDVKSRKKSTGAVQRLTWRLGVASLYVHPFF